MNDRLELAGRLLPLWAAPNETTVQQRTTCRAALTWADALIEIEDQTRAEVAIRADTRAKNLAADVAEKAKAQGVAKPDAMATPSLAVTK